MDMRKIDTVIFDLDGTLLYTLEDLANAVNFALGEFNMPLRTIEQIQSYVGNGIRMLMTRSVPDGQDNPDFERAFEAFEKYYGEHCNDTTRAYEGVQEMLHELKEKGYLTAIVSNKIDFAVKQLRDRYFTDVEVAIGDREGLRRKPEPDSVNQALIELGRTKEQAIYVGDSDVDIQTAQNAGLPCISVLWGFRDKTFLENHGAGLLAAKPGDVVRLIEEINK